MSSPLTARINFSSRLYALVDITCNLASTAFYVAQTYLKGSPPAWLWPWELVVAVFYIIDLIGTIARREGLGLKKFMFYLTVDLICIIPIIPLSFIATDHSLWYGGFNATGWTMWRIVYPFRFLRLSIHADGYLVRHDLLDINPFRRKVIRLYLAIFGLVLFASGVIQIAQAPASDFKQSFDEELFMSVLIMGGVSGPVPDTVEGKMLVMAFILVLISTVPARISELFGLHERLRDMNPVFKRGKDKHVIIMGEATPPSIFHFLAELYQEGKSGMRSTFKTVIYSSLSGTREERENFFNPRDRMGKLVTWISPYSSDDDLHRLRPESVSSVFIIANRIQADVNSTDADSIGLILRLKSLHDSPVIVQIRSPENEMRALDAGADHVVCVEALRLLLLGHSSRCQGIATLLYNLLRYKENEATQSVHHLVTWEDEYRWGYSNEIYSIPLPAHIPDELKFHEFARQSYDKLGVIVLGLCGNRCGQPFVEISPLGPIPKPREWLGEECTCIVIAADQTQANSISSIEFELSTLPIPSTPGPSVPTMPPNREAFKLYHRQMPKGFLQSARSSESFPSMLGGGGEGCGGPMPHDRGSFPKGSGGGVGKEEEDENDSKCPFVIEILEDVRDFELKDHTIVCCGWQDLDNMHYFLYGIGSEDFQSVPNDEEEIGSHYSGKLSSQIVCLVRPEILTMTENEKIKRKKQQKRKEMQWMRAGNDHHHHHHHDHDNNHHHHHTHDRISAMYETHLEDHGAGPHAHTTIRHSMHQHHHHSHDHHQEEKGNVQADRDALKQTRNDDDNCSSSSSRTVTDLGGESVWQCKQTAMAILRLQEHMEEHFSEIHSLSRPTVYVVIARSDPLSNQDLTRAGIDTTAAVVIGRGLNLQDAAMRQVVEALDMASIRTTIALRAARRKIRHITELVNLEHASALNVRASASGEEFDSFAFASGDVVPLSLVDSLTCRIYRDHRILDITAALLASPSPICIESIPPRLWSSTTSLIFGEVFEYFAARGFVVFGIYRSYYVKTALLHRYGNTSKAFEDRQRQHEMSDTEGDLRYFVFTAPPHDTIMQRMDKIYLASPHSTSSRDGPTAPN